jgi:hypothetical protein
LIPRPKYKQKKLEIPPKTRRYCLVCEKETTFKFERNIHHSVCVICGGHRSTVMKRKCPNCKIELLRKDKRYFICKECNKEFEVW